MATVAVDMEEQQLLLARRREARTEAQREREFYRYWEPVRQLSQVDPVQCNPGNLEAFASHTPRSSPDTALTAFCQLAALRFSAKRAMLFFFDTVSSYVLAEATQSLSLQDDARHELDDSLWLGYAVIPRGNSVCEHTVKMPLPPAEDSEIGSQIPIKVIPDLKGDTKFCGLPLVTGGPRSRFYAGVPIVTSKGINIGAFCVLDDVPRDGITEKDATFLRDMSTTVTTHLEIVRSKREQQRGMQMISGLGAFVQGCSDLRDWKHNIGETRERQNRSGAVATLRGSRSSTSLRQPKASMSYQPPPMPALPNAPSGMPADSINANGVSIDANLQAPRSYDRLARADSAPVESRSGSSEDSRPSLSPQGSAHQVPSGPQSRHSSVVKDAADKAQAQTVPSDIKSTYERAADLVREATEVHGVQFLDASIGTFGGLVESMGSHEDTDEASMTTQDTDSADNESRNTASTTDNELGPPKQCQILGSSVDPDCDQARQRPQVDITERFLKSLLRRYPHGMIWNFDEHGLASSEDELSGGNASDKSSGPSSRPNASSQLPKENTPRDKKKRKRSRVEDAQLIQRYFPGVRSIGLHGLWDQSRDRWYAACVLWTYSPLRIFSVSSEMNYVAAFCDVIMAETRRLEIQRVDNAKSSVLASVSHELRSPLHGILGSTEVLRDQPIDDLSLSLASQIESCGRTLLDIIDHLLDFSDINHFVSRRGKHSAAPNDRRRVSGGSLQKSQMGGMMSLDIDVALDEITEEVVEAAVYSFSCSKASDADSHVIAILDIDRPPNCNWRCRIAAGGWRRVVMNLVTNSLKYTTKGQVYIGLKSESAKGSRKRENVVLTVADSGQGMSKAFLEEGLYKAFSQENTLVEGMGLGMSMVAKIVQAFGGTIEVQSDQIGGGTRVLVTMPMEKSRGKQQLDPEDLAMRKQLLGVKAGIYNLPATAGTHVGNAPHAALRPTLLTALAKTLTQSGLGVVPASTLEDTSAQLIVVTERDLSSVLEKNQHDSNQIQPSQHQTTPLLILCDSVQSERNLRRHMPSALPNRQVEYISQPCGPSRLQGAVAACLRRQETASSDSGSQGLPLQDALVPPDAQHVEEAAKDPDVQPSEGHPKMPGAAPDDEAISPRTSTSRLAPAELQTSLSAPTEPVSAPDSLQQILPSSSPRPIPVRAVTLPIGNPPPPGSSGITLLLVDDNHINLSLLQIYARKNAHTALTATDGAQAVSAYKAAHVAVPPATPRVVVMDINMPVMNGFEATQQIRAYEQAQGLEAATIIALTGLGSTDAQREAFRSGLDLFLTKPVRLKELGRVIDGLKPKRDGA